MSEVAAQSTHVEKASGDLSLEVVNREPPKLTEPRATQPVVFSKGTSSSEDDDKQSDSDEQDNSKSDDENDDSEEEEEVDAQTNSWIARLKTGMVLRILWYVSPHS